MLALGWFSQKIYSYVHPHEVKELAQHKLKKLHVEHDCLLTKQLWGSYSGSFLDSCIHSRENNS